MTMTANPYLSRAVEELAEALDIPPGKYKEAVERYTAVGNWLDAADSPLKKYRPRVHPQGSFRLGTVIRPVANGREADYDIDLVCCLETPPVGIAPGALKNLIGDRFKDHGTYERMLDEEGRRCWTLNYAESDGIGFHLDALPSIPAGSSAIQALVARGIPYERARYAIEITQRRAENSYFWVPGGSNPHGYAEWFDSINIAARVLAAPLQKMRLFEAHRIIYASVQEVPDALVRSPLQRVIQILKRHRDVRFAGHPLEDEKPISMILTTLAALAYQGETDVAVALANVLERMEDYATSRVIRHEQGLWYIPSPVNHGENFADRWNEPGSRRPDAFFQWVAWARQDLTHADEQANETSTKAALNESFGGLPATSRGIQKSGTLVSIAADNVPALSNISHCQLPLWPVQQQYHVSVAGSVRKEIFSSKSLWPLTDRSVPKEFAIRFEASTNAPTPYDVKWQVVNTGTEAATAGTAQLRGGFDEGAGQSGTIRWEGTSYRGTHWIEAFVIKNGVCVARSGRKYVRIK